MNVYSNDLYEVLKKSAQQSRKYYQTFCGTPHLFLAMFSTLSQNKDTDRYRETYNNLKRVLNKYNVDGQSFQKSFLEFFPKGEDDGTDFSISVDDEFKRVSEGLKRDAIAKGRSMEIEDLIMALFEDKAYNIHMILSDIIGSDMKTDEMYDEIIKTFKPKVLPEVKEFEEMDELTNLNKWVKNNPQVMIDADEPVMKIEMALAGRSIRNCILTGPAGTGKTSYVYEFVQRINDGNVPEQFKDKIVYQLDPTALIAGTRYRGDFEEKLRNILRVVAEHKEVILFVDEIHTLVDLGGGTDGGGQSAGNLIKPYITRGEIQMIGCTTNEEYTKYLLPDKAFCSRFHDVKITEPTEDAVKKILEGLLPVETEFFNREIQEELIARIIKISEKYSLDQANPRKAINMLELACAYSKVFEEQKTAVDLDDVIRSVMLKYGYYISNDKIEDTRRDLNKELLGQKRALDQLVRDLEIVDRGIVDDNRPAISILLAGPTGVGKTRSVELIGKNFYGSIANVTKLNMGEYSAQEDVKKLTGSSAGYVGYDDEPALIKAVREKPNSVILFDEIEKSSKEVQKVLLNILDNGCMTDNKGNTVSFRNNIIIFTTNLGCTKDTGKSTGMGFVKSKTNKDNSAIQKAIEDYFSPEFLGRLDDIIYYDGLTNDIAEELINRYLKEYTEKAELDVQFTKEDIDEIIKAADIETRGARGIRKAVRKQIVEVERRKEQTTETVTA